MKNRIITFMPAIEEIIRSCRVCHLGMADEMGNPYVLPFNFGYDDSIFYLHSAPEGKKMDILKRNPKVCIALSTGYELRWQNEQTACSYSMKYKSVLAFGTIEFIETNEEKTEAMNRIMRHYTGKEFTYNRPAVENVAVFRVVAAKMECRVYGY